MALSWLVGPWIWQKEMPSWNPPQGFSGLDLRSIEEMSKADGTPGMGLFFGDGDDPGGDYTKLGYGHWNEILLSTKLKKAIPKRKGYTHEGDSLRDIVFNLLVKGADPEGHEASKPILPTVQGFLELNLGLTYKEQFAWGGKGTGLIQDVLRKDFAKLFELAQQGKTLDPEQHRRVLDFWCKQHKVSDWKEFVPVSLQKEVPGVLPHQTTITEDFVRADSTSVMGHNLTWTQLSGTWGTFSNQGYKVSPSSFNQAARAESDLSSADHYCQVVVGNGDSSYFAGPAARFNASAETCYVAGNFSDQQYITKAVSGTYTNLTNSAHTYANGETSKIQCNGTTIGAYANGSLVVSITDSAISGNLRCGVQSYKINATFSSWQSADLAASGLACNPLFGGGATANPLWGFLA